MRHNESKLQMACVDWFRYQYHHLAGLLFAIPNGGWRSKTEAGIMKAEGVLAGVADLMLAVPNRKYHGLFIEMKHGTGTQRETQKAFERSVTHQGYLYVIVRSINQFAQVINDYLDPEAGSQLGYTPTARAARTNPLAEYLRETDSNNSDGNTN